MSVVFLGHLHSLLMLFAFDLTKVVMFPYKPGADAVALFIVLFGKILQFWVWQDTC